MRTSNSGGVRTGEGLSDLAQRWRRQRDEIVAEAVIRACEPLIRSRVNRLRSHRVEIDDLLQVARLAVWKALRRYDPSLGGFTTYAVRTIDGEIKRYYRDKTWDMQVPRSAKNAMLRVGRARAELQASGLDVTFKSLEMQSQLDADEVDKGVAATEARYVRRLDQPLGDSGRCLGDLVPCADKTDIALRVDIHRLIRALPSPQDIAMEARYFQDMTQTEIAHHLGCSQMHVSRLLRRGRETLSGQIVL